MRSLACLVAVCALVFSATAVHADSAPVVRIHKVQDAAMDVFAGAGIAAAPDVSVRPRIIVTPKTSISFGFKGPAIKPVARLVPSRPIVQPTAFRGFGGFAAKVRCDQDGCGMLRVDDVIEQNDVLDEADVIEGKVDACGRIYTEHKPTEVTHQSSYYVPRLRRYVSDGCGNCATTRCEPCCDPCASTCCEPRVRRVYVVRRPVYHSCYRPVYRSCYSPCYSGCGWGPFWNGLGWGVGLGLGFGVAYGW